MKLKIPLTMFGFQIGLLLCLALVSKDLRNLPSLWTIAFWVYSLLSFIVFLYTSQTIPGFVVKNNMNAPKAKDDKISEAKPNLPITAPKDVPDKYSQPKIFVKLNEEKPEILPNSQNKHCESVNTEKSDDEEEKDNSHEYKNDTKSQTYKITVFPTLNQKKSQVNKSHSLSEVNNKDNDMQVKEIRYCTICRVDQPIRTKHCKECCRCVATHDHHCPWLGVCIGEKNKKTFYVYLIFQFFHILWALVLDMLSFETTGGILKFFIDNWLRMILALFLFLFLFMVGCLGGFHFYLATVNLTTWEFMSWNRISYLKNLDWSKGSPFSKGLIQNLYTNCCKRMPSYLIMWEISPTPV